MDLFRGRDPQVKGTRTLDVSFRDVNFGFRSRFGSAWDEMPMISAMKVS